MKANTFEEVRDGWVNYYGKIKEKSHPTRPILAFRQF
jgi:hypothetical protein